MIHKRYIHLIIFFLLTFYSKVAIANVGGDITYVNLGSSKYKIIFKYYRHCMWKSAPATMDLGWFLGNNGSKGTTPKTVTMTRTTIRDITPVCSTASNPCGSPNSKQLPKDGPEQAQQAEQPIFTHTQPSIFAASTNRLKNPTPPQPSPTPPLIQPAAIKHFITTSEQLTP